MSSLVEWLCHVQEQLQLGRGRLAEQRAHIVQVLTARAEEEEAHAKRHQKVEEELRSEVRPVSPAFPLHSSHVRVLNESQVLTVQEPKATAESSISHPIEECRASLKCFSKPFDEASPTLGVQHVV